MLQIFSIDRRFAWHGKLRTSNWLMFQSGVGPSAQNKTLSLVLTKVCVATKVYIARFVLHYFSCGLRSGQCVVHKGVSDGSWSSDPGHRRDLHLACCPKIPRFAWKVVAGASTWFMLQIFPVGVRFAWRGRAGTSSLL